MKKIMLFVTAALMALSLMGCGNSSSASSKAGDSAASSVPMTLENYTGERPQIEIVVTGYGTITAELYPSIAPLSVSNFLSLVDAKFFDGLTFHRIIDGFMIQGGAPNSESPSVEPIKGEFTTNGVTNTISHVRGVLSMARANDLNSATSQFFIVQSDSTYLDGSYAGFGKVLSGMEVVDSICKAVPVEDSNGTVLPENQPVISSIRRIS